ncbi:hypothetical protein J5N97_002260 [Dioscorea zingiberensis]|uniref:RING-type E3 ubiquitin transferase n=1 Tax=Dioscorea zingiberensis TaxID=325984 RepID=A0A9D5D3G8_9LILI|nr:hypothetical protein J5N97_002260 [Dioscorea zingiberensis]
MTPTTTSAAVEVAVAAATETLARTLTEICNHGAEDYAWDPPRRFTALAQRLQLLVAQLSHPGVLPSSPAVSTALRGIAGDVSTAVSTLSSYRSRSRIYVLIHSLPLCSSLRSLCSSLASSLALLDAPLSLHPELQKRASDLARDFLLSDLRVTEIEERVYSTLQREGEAWESDKKAVQGGIIMDLARALGAGPEALADQINLLRFDLTGPSISPSERRILLSLEKIFGSWSATEPCVADRLIDVDFDENATISPFKNFLCPLTKVVMKDPVVLESLQTYERAAIKHWFDWCLEHGRDPTCPVTGQVLNNLELKPNIGLAGAIEEWVNRNIEVQVKTAMQYLGDESSFSLEGIERALDNVYRISEEHHSSIYKVRNAGIIGLVVKMLKEKSKVLGSQLRTKALITMDSMAKDHESKLMMLEEGLSRLAVRSLNGSSEKEREYALSLLLQFSQERGYCAKIASEKGALVLLSSMAGNLELPKLSNMAEEVLKNMEREDDNVQHLAVVGRFQALLTKLCEGSEDVRIDMANIVGNMKLTNTDKEHIARQGGRALIAMLSSMPEGRASSLQALYNLSTLDDNSTILVDFGVLPALTRILFTTRQDDQPDLKDLAASTISNIVSNTGHWELSLADDQGHLMQSESIIHSLLQLLTNSSSKCQTAVLKILCGIASSPQALELVAAHIGSGNGIATIVLYLEQSETESRNLAFRLVNLLSRNLGLALAEELRASNKLILLKEKLLDTQCTSGEKSEIVCILANLPITDDEVKIILGTELLRWVVDTLKQQNSSSLSSNKSRQVRNMVEGLLGLLMHYAGSPDPSIRSLIQENHFMTIFINQLNISSHWRAKQRAALGLKYLSQSALAQVAIGDMEPQPPRGFCAPLVLICGKASMPSLCPIHNAVCEENSSFCLLKGNAIRPLVELMKDNNTEVQIAAVEALFTVVLDSQSLKNSTEELEQLGLFDAAVQLFKESRSGELQERVVAMMDRFFRVESLVQDYSIDQDLIRALVDALKHGTTNTKRLAQDILTNLRELSGVGGRNSNHNRGRRTNR